MLNNVCTQPEVVEMTNTNIKFERPFSNPADGTPFPEGAFMEDIELGGRGSCFRRMSFPEPPEISTVDELDQATGSVEVVTFRERPDKTTAISKLMVYRNCPQRREDEGSQFQNAFHGLSSQSESARTTSTEQEELLNAYTPMSSLVEVSTLEPSRSESGRTTTTEQEELLKAYTPVSSLIELPIPEPSDIMYVDDPIEMAASDQEKASSDVETIEAIPLDKIQELSVQKRDRYRCQQCGKKFQRSGALSTHVKTHSTVRLFHCAECGKSFKRSDHLNQHFRSHENTNPLHCSECGKRFKHSGAVVSHMRSHIVIGHFVCTECNREFKLYRYLQLHMQAHVQPEFIECGQLDRVDPRYYDEYLSGHGSRQQQQEKFACDECGKRFKNPGALRMHTTVHTSSRPFECSMCGKTFKDAPHLEQHMQVHTKCESLVCVECGKAFKNPRILATHVKIHSDDRPFECAGCGKTFKRSDHLSQHMRVHADERRHVCAECGGAYDVPELLYRHVVTSHSSHELAKRPFRCGDCGQSFPLRGALAKHRKVHAKMEPLECSECGKRFKHLGALNTHMKFHAKSRPFQCTECKKSFIIPNHLSRHMQAHYARHLNRQGGVKEEDPDSEASPE